MRRLGLGGFGGSGDSQAGSKALSIRRAGPTRAASRATTLSGQGPTQWRHGLQGVGVGDLGVVERRQGLGFYRPAGGSVEPSRRPDSPPLDRPDSPPGARRRGRGRPSALLGVEVAVPAAHRQAVGLADRGDGPDVDRDVQVGDHPADHQELLIVLGPEEGEIRPDDPEQLQDDRRHPPEMPRPARPLQAPRTRAGTST